MIASHAELVTRLNRMSVEKHHDAYADIAWDAPENAIDPDDARWTLGPEDPLGGSTWYRALPAATRARLGLQLVASAMRVGIEFERVLKLGLLELAATLPAGSADQRYVYHELIEEAQHALMFGEFVRRVHAVLPLGEAYFPLLLRPIRDRVPRAARHFPELFFVFVLGGEDPIDHVQRAVLASAHLGHPLLRRIMHIHVTEEARHLAFARSFLAERVPALSAVRKQALVLLAPAVLALMARLMLRPAPGLVRRFAIPRQLVGDSRHRARIADSLRKIHETLGELGLVSAPLWRRLGVA